jgi:2-oxoglutarate ferredoxin oxidoreductase subunit gamma
MESNMQTEILIAGFGGQGVLFAGQVLAYAAMDAGKEVTWFPSYGPEMRGGTANCTVIIAEEEIGSPLVQNPQAVIAMNLPSLDKFEPRIKSDGTLIINSSLISRAVKRTDLETVCLPATDMADALGEKRLANVIMLGALLVHLPVLSLEEIQGALDAHLLEHRQHLLSSNLKAFKEGMDFAKKSIRNG